MSQNDDISAETSVQRFNMAGFRAPRLDTVRVGVLGMGRGDNHIKALVQIEGVEIRAICDKDPLEIQKSRVWFQDTDHNPEIYTDSKDAWKGLCEQKDLDLIFICTPIPLHAEMSLYAMRQGKHVCCEVAAAWTVEDCWELVRTAEETRKHFMMLENYSYMDFHLVTINMAYRGFYGDIVHAEGAYNTSKLEKCFRKVQERGYSDMWWLREFASRRGILYPTHGLGPIATAMDINRGDRMEYLVYMEGRDFSYGPEAKKRAADDPFYEEFVGKPYRGNMGVALIRTVMGKTMMVQYDPHTPTPHNLIHGIYGTKGAALFDPDPPRFSKGDHRWYRKAGNGQEEYERLYDEYTPEILRRLKQVSKGHGHGGSDFRMNWHIIDCLRNGLPMPQDVYDAAAWSSIAPLTAWSAENRSASVDIPDFTRGAWKINARNMDINLENGGGNTKVLPPSKAGMAFDDELARQWDRDHGLKEGSV
ncbi:MAG: Gfo/Idh/MocA family oxidoreductase [Verrucomicrobia bacterium]|nr:Gfo/Idh/MocA family oxidoreductase [Verrucomicrobiota bacterium]MCH8529034.1 Gfo/Idh/MocA family oxidoreductase [Kiritimatiellia bacterium]